MKVRIDEEVCIACGICSQTCPDAFKARDEDNIAIIIATPDQLDEIECVQEAAESCPTGAIIIEEE